MWAIALQPCYILMYNVATIVLPASKAPAKSGCEEMWQYGCGGNAGSAAPAIVLAERLGCRRRSSLFLAYWECAAPTARYIACKPSVMAVPPSPRFGTQSTHGTSAGLGSHAPGTPPAQAMFDEGDTGITPNHSLIHHFIILARDRKESLILYSLYRRQPTVFESSRMIAARCLFSRRGSSTRTTPGRSPGLSCGRTVLSHCATIPPLAPPPKARCARSRCNRLAATRGGSLCSMRRRRLAGEWGSACCAQKSLHRDRPP